ncbi:hypothetical protein GGI35DRAFT_461786 [Trichoderma velutinum]
MAFDRSNCPRSFGHLIICSRCRLLHMSHHPVPYGVRTKESCAWSQNSAQHLICKCGRSTDYMVVNKMRNWTRVVASCSHLLAAPTSAAAVIHFAALFSSRLSLLLYASCTPFHIGALCYAKAPRSVSQSPVNGYNTRIRCWHLHVYSSNAAAALHCTAPC